MDVPRKLSGLLPFFLTIAFSKKRKESGKGVVYFASLMTRNSYPSINPFLGQRITRLPRWNRKYLASKALAVALLCSVAFVLSLSLSLLLEASMRAHLDKGGHDVMTGNIDSLIY